MNEMMIHAADPSPCKGEVWGTATSVALRRGATPPPHHLNTKWQTCTSTD